uniref:DDE Tnp4 domain-containing protein n=1 Tax=Anser brachyrhynchus TaxID=132585 RepID=A0A8B9BI22_9AVES
RKQKLAEHICPLILSLETKPRQLLGAPARGERSPLPTALSEGSALKARIKNSPAASSAELRRSQVIQTPKELENMVRIFRARWGFPHCIGALDSLHIPINPPLRLSADYCNGQGWHSILTQATVDGLGQFWDVSTAFPGSMENSAVLESSSLWHFMGKAQKYVLLGDATYPLQDWILKPYQEDENLTQRQLQFNYRLKRAHSVIENAFLRLKARWQILLKCDDCSLELLPTLVLACCILHNVCEAHDNPFNEEWLEGTEPTELPKPCQPAPAAMEDGRAEQVRELMCQYFESCGEG